MRKSEHQNFFKAWRKNRGLTQEQVMGRTGLDNTILSKLENGKIDYIQDHLEALSHAYNCEPGDLLSAPPDPKRPESEFEQFKRLKLKTAADMARALKILRAAFGEDVESA